MVFDFFIQYLCMKMAFKGLPLTRSRPKGHNTSSVLIWEIKITLGNQSKNPPFPPFMNLVVLTFFMQYLCTKMALKGLSLTRSRPKGHITSSLRVWEIKITLGNQSKNLPFLPLRAKWYLTSLFNTYA